MKNKAFLTCHAFTVILYLNRGQSAIKSLFNIYTNSNFLTCYVLANIDAIMKHLLLML